MISMRRTTFVVAAILFGAVSLSSVRAQVVGYSVRSGLDDQLYRVDLTSGTGMAIGPVGFGDVEGVAFQPGTNELYGWDDTTDGLIRIDQNTGAGIAVGPSGIITLDVGLTFDPSGNLWLADEDGNGFWSVDPNTGAATFVGSTGREITALAARGNRIYGIDDEDNALVTINTATAQTTLIGLLGIDVGDAGMAFDLSATLWGINDDGTIFTIDNTTGAATVVHGASLSRNEFESLDMPIPEPASAGLAILGLTLIMMMRGQAGRP